MNPNDPKFSQDSIKKESNSSRPYTAEPISSSNEAKRDGSTEQRNKNVPPTGHVQDKIKDTIKNMTDPKRMDDIYHYAISNKERTVAYILLALGVFFLLFVDQLIGGLIIGLLAGYYFSNEIVGFLRHSSEFFRGQDQVRYVISLAVILGLLVAAPGIIIGAALVAALKYIMSASNNG